jgi:8-oxo-dGTP pyrophosphatase MutT (NUDIX family)
VTWLGGEQVIPRPPGSYPGGPAPWADLPPDKRRGLSLERVLAAIERPEVGELAGSADPATPATSAGPATSAMGGTVDATTVRTAAASVMPGVFLEGDKIPSAVLVAMFEESGEARVILTRRSQNLRFHQGEVSFPGGRCDPGESAAQCALREAREETGLDPGLVTVTGELSPLATFSSESFITPVVGVLGARPPMRPNPSEVDLVFDVELAALVADGVFREERWYFRVPADGGPPVRGTEVLEPPEPTDAPEPADVPGRKLDPDGSFPVWFFELPGDTVWGATARVLMEVLRAVLDV